MAKKVLRFDEDEFGFLLIGISTTYRDFRVCREINIALSIQLQRNDDYTIRDPKRDMELSFPFFSFTNDCEDGYHVIGNKSEQGLLIPEQRSLDYFLIIKPGQTEIDITEISKRLKPIQLLQGVFTLDPLKLKSKENLLF